MKKILSIFTVFIFMFALVACKPSVDPAQEKLDAAYGGLSVLIKDPNMIVSSFNVPTKLKDGVTATWSTNEPGIASVGAPNAEGTVIITINRPSKGSGDAKVTLTATLVIQDAKGKDMEKKWSIELTVLEQAVEEIKIETIRDILNIRDDAYDPSDKKDKVQVTIKNATVFAEGSDSVFIYDGTGITQVYGGASGTMKQGKVYDVTGLLEWYFGLWEIIDSTAVEVDTQPQFPEKVIVDDVLEFRDDLTEDGGYLAAFGTAKDGNFEPIYARVTAKVHIIPGDTTNYNTYLLASDFEGDFLGDENNPAKGLMAYYYTNDFSYLKNFNGLEVELDVVIHTYRSNNYAFAFYYVGGPEGIELGVLSDEDKINLDFNAVNIPGNILDEATLKLPADGEQGTEFVWSYTDEEDENNDLIDLETGKVIPVEGEMNILKITVTATNGEGELVKNYEIAVGNYYVTSIEDIIANAEKDDPIRVKGVLLGNSATNNFWIYDGTAAFVVFTGSFSNDFAAFGKGQVVDITGIYNIYNEILQIDGIKENTYRKVNELMEFPEMVDASEFSKEEQLENFGALAKLENLKVKSIDEPNNAVEVTLENEDGSKTFLVRLDTRTAYADEVKDVLLGYEVGEVVSIEGLMISRFRDNPQFLFIDNPFVEKLEVTAIEDIINGEVELGAPIRIQGIFTGGTTPSAFWLQDDTGGLNLYVPSELRAMFAELTPGIKIEITGSYAAFNGMHEIEKFSISTIKLLDADLAMPDAADVSALEFNSEAFMDYHGALVKLVGFTIKEDGPAENKSDNIIFLSPTGKEFIVRFDNRTPFAKDVFNYLTTLKAGDPIDIDLLVVGWYNGPQLFFIDNPFA